ncbi:hypothetical protein J7F03_24835 [Streptomyces sp. ISL-43]|uniref:beta-1,3-glucanase family protein n=1 Tax=Streptomyces sp. ISL-43 TaxID=2819183 RepID=UPI001BE69DA1|nr:beta-1,3-glucanase family protein [Streptomyces sp. ISL-43]MBT2450243.1 hypothetical protein [Streptomyces sp. ISL-43]
MPSPPSIRGGRIYVSLGSPVYIPVSPDGQGWGGPDLRNPDDPNSDVYCDRYEYSYVHGQVAFGGNTTMVDRFGFPMTSRLRRTSSGYATHQFTLTRLGETFSGRVSGSVLTFSKNGAGSFVLGKPTSPDVMACAGAPASGNDIEKQLGAEFCAAFNRGVALDSATWYTPAAYYGGAAKNDYAGFFHTVGLDERAYGFPYDDVNDQSSVRILGNANPPTGLTLGIGW